MNITKNFLFQNINDESKIIMVHENADIRDMEENDNYRFIGCMNYDTEIKRVINM